MAELAGLSEDHLCQIWQWQRFLDGADLVTTAGVPVQVIYQGWRSGGAGPDFRDAIIAVGNAPPRLGPVEVHLRTSGWHAHHHDIDPHYAGAALHVVWEHDASTTTASDGGDVPTLVLRPVIGDRLDAILLALPPSAPMPPHGDFPCPGKIGEGDLPLLWSRLADLGEQRLLARADVLESQMAVQGPEQTWYAAVLEGLGYQRNVDACRSLASVVPYAVLRALAERGTGPNGTVLARATLLRLEAILLGASGLLPQQRPRSLALQQADVAYCNAATQSWLTDRVWCTDDPLTWDQWVLAAVRPANHPARRVAAMATLVAPIVGNGLATWLRSTLHAARATRLLAMAVENDGSYWSEKFDFGRPSSPAPQALVGTERAIALAVNATLPCAVALARLAGDRPLYDAAVSIFHGMPAPGQHRVSRQMLWQILDRPAAPRRASEEQGLVHAYRQWCQQKRCWDCALFAVHREA